MCINEDESVDRRMVSFAGLHSAVTDVCCANPCKTDYVDELPSIM